jgi:hypothetical protein
MSDHFGWSCQIKKYTETQKSGLAEELEGRSLAHCAARYGPQKSANLDLMSFVSRVVG